MRISNIVFLSFLLAACGGGGSGGSSPTTPPPSTPPSSPPADTTVPDAPSQNLSDNADGTLRVTGSAEAGSVVGVTFPDGSFRSMTATQNGDFGPIDSSFPQPNGIVSAIATDDSGNQSVATETNYVDSSSPAPATQTVQVNDDDRITVSGTAEPLSTVNIAFPDGEVQAIVASNQGAYGPVVSTAPQVNGSVSITVADINGNVSVVSDSPVFVTPEFALWELASNPMAQDIARFLTQATFGPTEDDIQDLVFTDADYTTWIDEQLEVPATNVRSKFESRSQEAGLSVTSRSNLDQSYHKQLIASDMLWDTFANGDDQLRQRVAFALSQIFVVSETSDTLFNNARGVVGYHDMLAEHALGNYRDLIEAVTLSPIMGEYLSMIRNEKANSDANIRPDENYARELLQLFSIGLLMLNQDGSLQLDEQGQPISTYDQEIIKSFARVFTGWTYDNATFWNFEGWLYGDMLSPMKAFEAFHDTHEKVLLSQELLPAGQSALTNLQGALDNIFNHQNVPPFISKQLIQKLVTSNPSPEYVSRISAVFRDNGNGERGDLGAVVKAILLDEEARTGHVENPNTFGKVKEPVLKFTALIRAFDVAGMHPINGAGTLRPALRYFWAGSASGQSPYGAPSVFNFFRPDFSPAGPIRDAGLMAPELQILNESFITNATNYGSAAIFNSYDFLIDDCQDRLQYLDGYGCPAPDFSDEIALANKTEQLLSRLDLLMLAGDMGGITKEALTLLAQQQSEPRFVVAEVVHLIYISPEFAVQR